MKQSAFRVVVIDGQGGRMGRQLVEEILRLLPEAELTAIGTNSIATASMLKGGVKNAATGENAVLVASRTADVIAGPIGIVMADALLGEITPAMAAAVGASQAKKVLIPVNRCGSTVAGVTVTSMGELIRLAAEEVKKCALGQED